MAVSFVAVGDKGTTGTATVAVPYPAGVAAGQLALAGRCVWRDGVVIADETGWTDLGELEGGVDPGSALNDNHVTAIRVDSRELTGSESGSVSFDQASADGVIGVMVTYACDGDWDVAASFGEEASPTHDNIERTLVGTTAIDFAVGDVLVVFTAFDSNAAGLTDITGLAASASGITFSTVTSRTPLDVGSSTGNDGNIGCFEATVTAGSGTVAPAFTYDSPSTNVCGPAGFVRLRESGGGEEKSTTGTTTLVVASTGTVAKAAVAAGATAMTLDAAGTTAKAGTTVAVTGMTLGSAAAATKAGATVASSSLELASTATVVPDEPVVDVTVGATTLALATSATVVKSAATVGTTGLTLTAAGITGDTAPMQINRRNATALRINSRTVTAGRINGRPITI